MCMVFVPFVLLYVFPRAEPEGIHITARRVSDGRYQWIPNRYDTEYLNANIGSIDTKSIRYRMWVGQ